MSTKELIAGYAAYTDAAELGDAQGEAPAISMIPSTTTVPFPVSVDLTIDVNC